MSHVRLSLVVCASVVLTGGPLLACARVASSSNERASRLHIFGGSRVKESDPLSGSTVALIRSNGYPFCTGSYMGGNTILTAAHCVTGLTSPLMYVSFDLETPTEFDPLYGDRGAQSLKSRRVSNTLVHAGFDRSRVSKKNVKFEPTEPINDVALVFFEGAPPADSRAVRIIEPGVDLAQGADITLAGFGHSDAGGGDYGRLYKVNTHVGGIRNTSLEFVDGPNFDKGSCLGDSGGPVVVGSTHPDTGQPELTVTGIVSYGPSECETGTGINTDLRFFHDWVSKNLNAPHSDASHGGQLNDLRSFVPTAEGSFYQMCRDKEAYPEFKHTLEVLLQKLGESDCHAAAAKALRVRELDLSHNAIQDIRPLSHFVALEKLDLSYNNIQELSPISSLNSLQELNLEHAGVQWNKDRRLGQAAPWKRRSVDVLAQPAGLSPGVWLTALKNLKVLKTSGPDTPDITPRYARNAP